MAYSSPEVGTAQVYRFHLTQENRHFYTANDEERNHIISSSAFSSWSYEGIAFNVFSQEEKPQSAIPVVRYFNANYNSHLYSSSVFEQDLLNSSLDWVNEGTAWYGQSI